MRLPGTRERLNDTFIPQCLAASGGPGKKEGSLITSRPLSGPPVRATLRDAAQTISFLAGTETAARLVAGCSVDPATVGDLLVATDIYEPGLTTRVTGELMAFDNSVRREGPAFVQEAVGKSRETQEPLGMTFQVIDEVTEGEALRPPGYPVVVFDLPEKVIRRSAGLELSAAGEVRIHDRDGATNRTVSYFLPKGWRIETL